MLKYSTKIFLLSSFIICLFMVIAVYNVSAWSPYEYFKDSGSSGTMPIATTYAQTFTVGTLGPDEDFDLQYFGIHLKHKNAGDGIGTLTVSLRATSGGKPTGGNIRSDSIGTLSGGTDWTWYWFDMTGGGAYEFQSGTKYAIVMYLDSYTGSRPYQYGNGGDGYAGGGYCVYGDHYPGGWYWDASSTDYEFMVLGSNSTLTYTGGITSIEETSATMNLYRLSDDGNYTLGNNIPDTCTVGFWYNTSSPVTEGSSIANVTIGSYEPIYTTTQSESISSLTPGEYYYVQMWCKNNTEFNASGPEYYFLTKPDKPTSLTVTGQNATNISLSWTNATIPAGTNQTTVIVYKTGSYATTVGAGTVGYNGTAESCTIEGLSSDTRYYFSAFTYINASGSPYYWHFSDTFDGANGITEGGNFNVTVRYENRTYGRVDLSKYGPHKLEIHYEDEIDYIIFNATGSGDVVSDVVGYFDDNSSGNFSITTDKNVWFMVFHWNFSHPKHCERTLVVRSGQTNYTFYIIRDSETYLEATSVQNGTLVKYTYGFSDNPGVFLSDPYAFAYIYLYNDTGERMIIHSEFFDATDHVYPHLVYHKKYYIGVWSTSLVIDRCGVSPAMEDTEPTIEIPWGENRSYAIYDLFDISVGWMSGATGFFVDYLDTTYSIVNVTFNVYHDDSLVYTNYSTLDTFNFTYDAANQSWIYEWELIFENGYELGNNTLHTVIFPGMESVVNYDYLDTMLEYMFGTSPFSYYEDGVATNTVAWGDVVVFVIGFILLVTFGYASADIAGIAVGAWWMAAPAMITGANVGYFFIGLFILSIAVLYRLGGGHK